MVLVVEVFLIIVEFGVEFLYLLAFVYFVVQTQSSLGVAEFLLSLLQSLFVLPSSAHSNRSEFL